MNIRHCFSFWFIYSVCLSVCGWNAVNSFVSISNILFNTLVIFAANYGPLSDITLSDNPCNFHTLSLNNCASLSTNFSFIVATKYVILDNLSQTTRIASFLATNGNFMIKLTIKYVHNFSEPHSISTFLLVLLSYFLSSDIYHIFLHIVPYFLLLLATNYFL